MNAENVNWGREVEHKDERTIQTEVWVEVLGAAGKPTGHIKRKCGRKLSDVDSDLYKRLGRRLTRGCDYFSVSTMATLRCAVPEWPGSVRWIACYAVTGGSEGHYVHVDAIVDQDGMLVVKHLFVCKTFNGMKHAAKVAARCAELLGA